MIFFIFGLDIPPLDREVIMEKKYREDRVKFEKFDNLNKVMMHEISHGNNPRNLKQKPIQRLENEIQLMISFS